MNLYLMRHGKAGLATDDLSRPLLPEGAEAARLAGATLKEMGVVPGLILHSAAVRAAETARIVAAELGLGDRLCADDRLFGAHDYRSIIKEHLDSMPVLVVAHEPVISDMVKDMTGQPVVAHTGEVFCVEGVSQDLMSGSLAWRLRANRVDYQV